ncbi:hypothetical protein [Caballeronia sp. INSB1]|uniref:hypothetical protein n=1 Tax=Caballeronia sp. INSB1 TaxID=2921751 RepID=UPI002032522D|nr:hypothetical protein [Caballeronia sp. INSB1]
MQLALLYTFFAAIATFANIGAQDLTTRLYTPSGGDGIFASSTFEGFSEGVF